MSKIAGWQRGGPRWVQGLAARRPELPRYAVALAAGALWGLCLASRPLSLAPWIALIPLLLLLDQPRPGRLGLLHGLAAWLVSIPWIASTLETYGELPGWLAVPLLVLLAGYLACFHLAFAALGARLWRSRSGWALAGLPALWVALEWLRAHLFGGFPWNLAAYAVTDVPGALPLASWVGAYGVSFLLVATNTALAWALARRRGRPLLLAALAPLLLPAATRLALPAPAAGGAVAERAVRLVQPDTENLVTFDAAAVAAGYRKLLELSYQACDRPGALVLWPESAAWPYTFDGEPRLRGDLEDLAAFGCPVLFNSVSAAGGRYYNSAYLLDAAGVEGRYDKRHLVPWGEYVPLGDLLPFVGKLARNAGGFSPGRETALLPWGDDRIGVAICFEVIFPEAVAAQVRDGATLLATLTNDAWYGDSSAPRQHLRAARFRAAENRRPLLRAAITGISAVVAADGALAAELGVGEEGVLRGEVRGRRDLAPYTRAPWLVPGASLLLGAFAIFRTRRKEK